MDDWFTIDRIDEDTYAISEYRHREETHCYLLNGTERSLLIDTGLGICNISKVVSELTDKPVTAIATHIHWDHLAVTNTILISMHMSRSLVGSTEVFRSRWK